MANIPGIVGWVQPGAYSLVDLRPGPVSLPGGPTIIAILGKGKREEYVVTRAIGGGKDGLPVGFNPANKPDGRHFQLSFYPIVPGTLEIFINPKGDGTDLPLIRVTDSAMAQSWEGEFGDIDGYSGFAGFNGPYGDSVDAYQSTSGGLPGTTTGAFFTSKYAKQYAQLQAKLGITAGSLEPNHYIFNDETGQFILDQALNAFDTLVVSYIGQTDLNSPELFTDISKIYVKHGYPSVDNTISLAATMANENGATVFVCVHAGEKIEGEGSSKRLIQDPYMNDALKALEKEEVDYVIPIVRSRIYNEVIMPFYDGYTQGTLTDNGRYLQEDPTTGDQPGINISPLAVIPVGQPSAGAPTFLEVYKNGVLLQYGIDYSVPNLNGSSLNGTTNVLIALDPTYPGATHTIVNTLVDGDKITASYLPDSSVINLVATGQLATLTHCQIMSETKNRKERKCISGGYEFVDMDFITDPTLGVEASFGTTKRMEFFWACGPFMNRVIAGENQIIDSQYLAACAAGYKASHTIPTSLTNKTLTGFTIDPSQKLSTEETNLVGEAGVSIVTPLAAGGKVVASQTTTNSGRAVEEEPSVVAITDYTSKTVRVALENAFTGSLITVNTPKDVEITTANILAALQSQGIIKSYANVKAVVDPQEPRQIDVTFDIVPVFPLNWIFIRFSVGI